MEGGGGDSMGGVDDRFCGAFRGRIWWEARGVAGAPFPAARWRVMVRGVESDEEGRVVVEEVAFVAELC